MTNKFPSISIVTAVRNEERTIRECLESVRNQTYPAYEHIFVDGLSSDNTLNIINKYADNKTKIISEADSGLYDAMNKGIAMAGGDVVGILNADDKYASSDILMTVANSFTDPEVEACYGDLVYVDQEDTSRVIRHFKSSPCSERLLYRGWMPPHPTFFVRRHIYDRYGVFRTDLGSAADYELTLRFLLRHGIRSIYIPKLMVIMRAGGASNASILNRIKVNIWIRRAWRINGLKPKPWTMITRYLDKAPQYFGKNKVRE